MSTSCDRTACSQLLEQVWNKLLTTCNKLGGIISDLSQGCSNKSDTVMINKNVTRLTIQGCNNTVIS
jgi:hypothetical protein